MKTRRAFAGNHAALSCGSSLGKFVVGAPAISAPIRWHALGVVGMATVVDSSPPLAVPDLSELVAAAAAGDADATGALARELLPRVHAIVHREIQKRLRLPGDGALARLSTGDVVQDVLLEVLRGLDRWEVPSEDAFVSLLATLVEHRLTDRLRYHHAGLRDVRRHEVAGPATAGVHDDRTPSRAAMAREQQAIYRQVLATFSDRERALIAMRLEDKVGFNTIAERLAFPTGDAARKAFHVLQGRLATRLRKHGLGPAGDAST